MKKVFTLIILLSSCIGLSAAPAVPAPIKAEDINLVYTGEQVAVTFKFTSAEKSVKHGYSLVVIPVLRNGSTETDLTPIVVQSKKAKIAEKRHILASGVMPYGTDPIYTTCGQEVQYATVIGYEEWMTGSELALEGISVGCCSMEAVEIGTIAENLLYKAPITEIEITETLIKTKTTGDILAEQFPFVVNYSEYEALAGGVDFGDDIIQRIIRQDRSKAQSVHFKQGYEIIERNYMDNEKALVELVATLRTLESCTDSKIEKIIIVGYTSPEGSNALNQRLAGGRAETVKNFMLKNTTVSPSLIKTYNDLIDWQGLRDQVAASAMHEKYQVLDIIDNTPVWDSRRQVGRHGQLMRVNGGSAYRYMYNNYFPKMRNASFIKIYYKNINE